MTLRFLLRLPLQPARKDSRRVRLAAGSVQAAGRVTARLALFAGVACWTVGLWPELAGAEVAATRGSSLTSVACGPGITAPQGSALSQPWEFPKTALHGRPGAEFGHDEPAKALRKVLTGRQLENFPRHRYLVLRRTSGEVLYGHISSRSVDLYLAIGRSAGRWTFKNGGSCTPSLVYPGREVPTFTLAGRPARSAGAIVLYVRTGTCSVTSPSPLSRVDRVLESWSRHRLLMTVLLRPESPTPGSPCTKLGARFRLRVMLPRPLGGRTVYDGSLVPPTTAAVGR